ncbi:MAG: hypothetical protein FWH41_03760 [Treponema sp.]|nr:hypothetical protein [Treponema sp.]
MSRGIIIAGNESALLSAVEGEAARRGEQYAIASVPNRFSSGDGRPSVGAKAGTAESPPGRISLEWNPGRPISAHALVLAAENRLGTLGGAILVCEPPSGGQSAGDLNLADIEIMANDYIKGWLFLVKEIVTVYKERGKGSLALVYRETGDAADILGSAALAAFRSITRGVLAAPSDETCLAMGFSCADAGDETGFASFIFKQLEEAGQRGGGKLHKYGKSGFFK